MESESVYSDQSQVGAATQKTTEWKVTAGLLPSARLILGTLHDASYRRNTPETSLIAGNTRDYSKSAAAAKYTPQQWERLVRVALSTSPFIKEFETRPVITGAEQDALAQTNAPAPIPASVQRSRRDASDARYTVEGTLHRTTDTRASLDKARRLRGQVTCVDGSLVALHILQQCPSEPDECMLEDMAVMVLQSRHQQFLALRNLELDSLRNLDTVIEAVDVRCVLLCIETGETVSSSAVMALADGLSVPVHLDTAFSRDWHKPVTYRDFLRSPMAYCHGVTHRRIQGDTSFRLGQCGLGPESRLYHHQHPMGVQH